MDPRYPIIEVLPQWTPQPEDMGSKEKFWFAWPEENEAYWLFKYPRVGRGEHWAEKIAAEVAGLLEVSFARVELAVFRGDRGSAAETIAGNYLELVHGNEVLENAFPPYDSKDRNFHLSDHTLENIWLALDGAFENAADAIEAKRRLASYLVLDAVIGNTDRHSENWGILRNLDESRRVESLAPSYDHGSSLGRELMDMRRDLYISENRVGEYVERGRGQIHWFGDDRRGPSPLELVRLATPCYPDLFIPAITKLEAVDESSWREIVWAVPEDWMTPTARMFAFDMMCYSIRQLKEIM